jgi:hypothetical protein
MKRRTYLALVLALLAVVGAGSAARVEHARAAEPQKLFALDADQGVLTPLTGKQGMYRLVLEDVSARANYFTDRPEREVGTVPVRPMLRRLFAEGSPPPNAAVNASAPGRGQLLMGIEIDAWRYDAGHRKLALRVRHLPQGGRTIGHVREDVVLPRSFSDVSMFIDDCCSVVAPATVFNPGPTTFALSINNGPQVQVPNASRETWLPGSAPISFNNSPEKQPGVLSPGPNTLAVNVQGAPNRMVGEITLPSSIPYYALQLYVFMENGRFEFTVLNNGTVVGTGTGQ